MKQIVTLVPWFGSNRTLAENVGVALDRCDWVGVPFAGGMSELLHIPARTIVVSDLHRNVINLARVVAHEKYGPKLIKALRRMPFHVDLLAYAREIGLYDPDDWESNYHYALCYFVTAWMSRNGTAGTDSEFTSGLSVRWEASGGDSVVRFRSATKALMDWKKVFQKCTFIIQDVFSFLTKVKDLKNHGLYLDPPFPTAGEDYKHKFSVDQHRNLALRLMGFANCRIVCRFYDHPLVRELYQDWKWHYFEGRTQTNVIRQEVLLTRN